MVIYSLNVTKFGHLIPVSIEERTTEQIHETESLTPLTIHTSFGSFTDEKNAKMPEMSKMSASVMCNTMG